MSHGLQRSGIAPPASLVAAAENRRIGFMSVAPPRPTASRMLSLAERHIVTTVL